MFDASIASEQEVFDYVIGHLVSQGRQSIDKKAKGGWVPCAYRGENGAKCAVGALIPDEIYDDGMEGSPVDMLIEQFPRECVITGIIKHANLLIDLQKLHDDSRVWRDNGRFKDRVVIIAKNNNLNVPPAAFKFKVKE